ncbi:hypothetical protein [Prochlorococcus sp. MIT 1201]|uniref:hypothetical protein n=1 Tax=Prochlorococcus sp. MIT 1201 TaxID=3082535 RepID=UPI0039A42D1F
MGKWIFGGLGYVFIFLMALTSTDRAQQWMGMKNWKRLNWIDSDWLWNVFLLTYVEPTREDPKFYIPFPYVHIGLAPFEACQAHNHKDTSRSSALKSLKSKSYQATVYQNI